MLATDILIQDHLLAISLVDELEGVINDERGNRETFRDLKAALELHIREEEEVYYPALAELDEFSDLMDENVAEHAMVRANLAQMSELSPADATFQTLLTETRLALEAHMEIEESDIFPRSIELLGEERINELGNQIDQMKGDAGLSLSAGI
ncbi:MAG TPA: hemerythrin domain-containing protein [Pyrinomonadaceae bacterium]|nr:hemerythrin domain-containing protein [Pyrinomonadaceae bacterium]